MKKISIIGSGNVAHHLIKKTSELTDAKLHQVFARNINSLKSLQLPSYVFCEHISNLDVADLYIIAVNDAAIAEVSEQLHFENRLVVHTSGTVSLREIDAKNRRGVFYPLQTFSKEKTVNFEHVPLCLETEHAEDYALLETIAKMYSTAVYPISEKQRQSLHVAAVFANNFTNHMYAIAEDICSENQVPFAVLQPLIEETAEKIKTMHAVDAQTGPAKRKDEKTVQKHIDFIQDTALQSLYKNITQSIQNYHVKKF